MVDNKIFKKKTVFEISARTNRWMGKYVDRRLDLWMGIQFPSWKFFSVVQTVYFNRNLLRKVIFYNYVIKLKDDHDVKGHCWGITVLSLAYGALTLSMVAWSIPSVEPQGWLTLVPAKASNDKYTYSEVVMFWLCANSMNFFTFSDHRHITKTKVKELIHANTV